MKTHILIGSLIAILGAMFLLRSFGIIPEMGFNILTALILIAIAFFAVARM